MGKTKSELRFDGRVAIVTGAGAGCGREFALLLGQRGATVIINDISEAAAAQTQELIEKQGGTSFVLVADISNVTAAKTLVEDTIAKCGRVDIVINNAGNWMARAFDEYTEAEFQSVISSHFLGSAMITQAAWPYLKKQHYGRIIMMASASFLGPSNMAAYGAAKGALIGLSNSLAVEGKPYNITCNSICPGAFTKMLRDTFADDHETRALLEEVMPASAIAPVAGWLVHDTCQESGRIVIATGHAYAEFFIGETLGAATSREEYSVEFVRDNFERSTRKEGYLTPRNMMETAPTATLRAQRQLN
jgi:NAD(P)-dependent dehydrogenase (short-subunit alcohol dehydrogenase family)